MRLLIVIIIIISIWYFIKNKNNKTTNHELDNIIHVVLKNKYKITKNEYENYQNSHFFKYLYQNNKKTKTINNSLEKLIIDNYNAYINEKEEDN